MITNTINAMRFQNEYCRRKRQPLRKKDIAISKRPDSPYYYCYYSGFVFMTDMGTHI